METYRLKLRKRIAVLSMCVTFIAAFLTLENIGVLAPAKNDFMEGFLTGFLTGIAAVFSVFLIRFMRALNNEEQLKKLYIYETDERRSYILTKSGGLVMYSTTTIVLIAGIIAGYYNMTVFYSLLAAAVFQLLVMGTLKMYYSNTH